MKPGEFDDNYTEMEEEDFFDAGVEEELEDNNLDEEGENEDY